MKDIEPTELDELNPIDGFLLEMLGEYHRHLCVSCDGAKDGCINCRKTGYNQTPCLICDKDGIAFKNRREFLDKTTQLINKSYISRKAVEELLKETKTYSYSYGSLQNNTGTVRAISVADIKKRLLEDKK